MQTPRPGSTPEPELVAALDLGSNSFHMVIARNRHGALQVMDRLKEMVRLAGGLDADGRLEAAARERALACLHRFGQRLREFPVGSVRAVGTNTLRQLHDDGAFMADAEAAIGHSIEIVSGYEEARLIYLGVAHAVPEDGERRLVIDIGGGSTELIVGESLRPLMMESLHMGCVSMTRRFLADGLLDAARFRRLRDAVLMELEPIQYAYRVADWEHVVGASGTVRAVQSVVEAEGWSERGITREALEPLQAALLDAGHSEKLKLRGLSAERRPVFAAGVLVLSGIFEALDIERMRVSDGALREGLLYDLLGRIRNDDTRDRTVTALQARYHVDTEQAQRVTDTALRLFEQVQDAWQLGDDYRRLLRWAAQLHEIGLDIAHGQYQKHGAYVARNADMAGFSRQDQAATAALIRCHRRKIRTGHFSDVTEARRGSLIRLAVLLRLAVVLHRGRNSEPLPTITLRCEGQTLRLGLPGDWLAAHPLTVAELEQEAASLQAVEISLHLADHA